MSTPHLDPRRLADARRLLGQAERVVLFTGAGISAESGVPTFRDRTGLWARFNPQELATPEGFGRDPHRVWEWYRLRRAAILKCQPNLAHLAMARFLEAHDTALLVTQNVDGLHQKAVAPEMGHVLQQMVCLHGDIHQDLCSRCRRIPPEDGALTEGGPEALPSCPHCGALLRPGVIWFGELLPSGVLERALEAASRADVSVVVGTSALVYPAAGVPMATLQAGGSVIEVNTEATALTALCHVHLRGTATDLVPALLPA